MALLRPISLLFCFTILFGCGGGDGGFDGNDGEPDVSDDAITISLAISNENVTESTPATLSATVLKGKNPLASEVVTFSTSLGYFSPESGTALTSSEGVATMVLNAGEIAGAGEVLASLSTGEVAKVGFTTQGVSTVNLRLGNDEGTFVDGTISLTITELSAGQTSVVSVKIVDDQENPYLEPASIEFSSVCSGEDPAKATLDSPVSTKQGVAQSTYFAKGCVGDDLITVNTIINDQNLTATGVINVAAANVGGIEFVSATPEHISIKGVGSEQRPESSTVVFKVVDTNGSPITNQAVDFSLASNSGEITLNPANASTNGEGLVQTVISSGTVARTIRVIAKTSHNGVNFATQSSELKISTGIPDQDSISISVSNLNPMAWGIDGAEVIVTARLGDDFNNPPPPTTVYFTTEGGSIETLDSTCTTDIEGKCSVIWRSQSPRPEGQTLAANGVPPRTTNIDTSVTPPRPNFMGQKYGGRVTILATATGAESFPDLNGNGRFDECEVVAFTGGTGKPCNSDGTINTSGQDIDYSGNDVSGNPYDLNEAFVDHNEDGFFNPMEENGLEQLGGELEEPVDFNNNGSYDTKDGKYNGVLCSANFHDGCSTQQSIDIRDQAVIVMSGSTPYWCINSSYDSAETPLTSFTEIDSAPLLFCENKAVDHNDDGNSTAQDSNHDNNLVLPVKGTASFTVVMADLHNQPLPSGTNVSFKSTVGELSSSSDWLNTNRNGGSVFGGTLKGGDEAEAGVIEMVVTFPDDGGSITYTLMNVLVL